MVTPLTANGRASSTCTLLCGIAIAALTLFAADAEAAPPKIRTGADNAVPRCVTPKRLMAFLKTRNPDLDPRYADIAALYKKHGETWHVRWDYAFFQMAVETNFLTYKKGDGDRGDVNPKQNNFAGLGTTGGGVPGDSYPDVTTGVLAQIQHLVVYSGEHIDNPVGARTRLKQDDIIEVMAAKKGNTTFADLSRRWAADRHYGASIEWVANSFRQLFCTGAAAVEAAEAPVQKPAKQRTAAQQQELTQVANLGGPAPAEGRSDDEAPVRTVWSAANAGEARAPALQAAADAQAQPPARKGRAAPLPLRKPAVATATASGPVVAEQIIQTGEDPAPAEAPVPSAPTTAAASATAVTAPAVASAAPAAPPASEPAPARLTAFAYATALGSVRPKVPSAAKAAPAGTCSITSASYGGKKVLLVRSADTPQPRFTVLTVLEGFEKSMLDNYLKAHAPGGSSVGEFASKDAALAKAKELCSRAAGTPEAEGASAG